MEQNLKKERLTADELLMQLRTKMVFHVSDVEFAIMEPSGMVNVLLKKENQPLTPKQMGIQVAAEEVPQVVIMDGKILDEGLSSLGYNRGWLTEELTKLNVALNQVFLAQVNSSGQIYVDLYDDQ